MGLENDFADRMLFLGIEVLHFPADHHRHDVGRRQIADRTCGDMCAVANDGDGVGNLGHFSSL